MVITGLVLALAIVKAAANDVKKTDAEMIRGAWKVVSAKETAGFEDNIDVTEYLGSTWIFDANEFTTRP